MPSETPAPIPMRIPCPDCGTLHIDEGEFATKPHHTHSCQACGMTWRPAVVHTVGVRFLPGFKDEPASTPPATPGDAAGDNEPPACTCDNDGDGSGGCDRSRWFAARNESYEICSRTAPGAGTAPRSRVPWCTCPASKEGTDDQRQAHIKASCLDEDVVVTGAAAGTAGEREP